jgi:hypothetical protein
MHDDHVRRPVKIDELAAVLSRCRPRADIALDFLSLRSEAGLRLDFFAACTFQSLLLFQGSFDSERKVRSNNFVVLVRENGYAATF